MSEPLKVTAELAGPIALPDRTLMLDGLVAWSVAQRDQLPPPIDVEHMVPVEIPIDREPDGRFHLCSAAEYEVEAHDSRWINRRFPIPEAQDLGDEKLKRILLSGGPTKSYRLPLETIWLKNDRLWWYCVGDPDELFELLQAVGYLGKKRATGLGRVHRWTVRECDTWEGFPVTRDGLALRPLPTDWPTLVDPHTAYSTLTYPYWAKHQEQLCAVP